MINDNSFIQFLRILKKDDNLTKDDVRVIQGLAATDSRITNLFTAFVKFKNKEITPANYQMIYNSMASKYQGMLDEKPEKAEKKDPITGTLDFSSIDLAKDKEAFIKYLTYVADSKAGKEVDSNVITELRNQNAIVKALEDIKVAEENGFVEKGTYTKNYNLFLAKLGELTKNAMSSKKEENKDENTTETNTSTDVDFNSIDLSRDKESFIKYLTIVTDINIGKEIDTNLLEELKSNNKVIKALEDIKALEERGSLPKGSYRAKYNELLSKLGELTRAANARSSGNIIGSVKDIKKINSISTGNVPEPSNNDNLGDFKNYIANELGDIKRLLHSDGDLFKLNDLSLKTRELYDYYKLEIKSKKVPLSRQDIDKINYLIANNDDIKLVSGAKKMYREGAISFNSYNNLNEYFFEELKEGLIKDLLPDKDLYFRD